MKSKKKLNKKLSRKGGGSTRLNIKLSKNRLRLKRKSGGSTRLRKLSRTRKGASHGGAMYNNGRFGESQRKETNLLGKPGSPEEIRDILEVMGLDYWKDLVYIYKYDPAIVKEVWQRMTAEQEEVEKLVQKIRKPPKKSKKPGLGSRIQSALKTTFRRKRRSGEAETNRQLPTPPPSPIPWSSGQSRSSTPVSTSSSSSSSSSSIPSRFLLHPPPDQHKNNRRPTTPIPTGSPTSRNSGVSLSIENYEVPPVRTGRNSGFSSRSSSPLPAAPVSDTSGPVTVRKQGWGEYLQSLWEQGILGGPDLPTARNIRLLD